MATCFFSSHTAAENRELCRDILSSHFDDLIDIFSKDSLPSIPPGSILFSDRTTFFFKANYLEKFEMAFNVHPSLLPRNKGSFPLLWACLRNEPHGVSIHKMNADVDAGDIVFQKVVPYTELETFSHVFYRSRQYIAHALHHTCLRICAGTIDRGAIPQEPDLFHHKKKDGEILLDLLPLRWNTPIGEAREILKGKY